MSSTRTGFSPASFVDSSAWCNLFSPLKVGEAMYQETFTPSCFGGDVNRSPPWQHNRGSPSAWIVEVAWATKIDCCLAKGSKTSVQKLLLLRAKRQGIHTPGIFFANTVLIHSNRFHHIPTPSSRSHPDCPPIRLCFTMLHFTFRAVLRLKLGLFFSKEK